MTSSTVKSARRSEASKARWADPAYAARQRELLAANRAKILANRAARAAGTGAPPADPPPGGGAPAPAPFTDRRLFGRRRSS